MRFTVLALLVVFLLAIGPTFSAPRLDKAHRSEIVQAGPKTGHITDAGSSASEKSVKSPPSRSGELRNLEALFNIIGYVFEVIGIVIGAVVVARGAGTMFGQRKFGHGSVLVLLGLGIVSCASQIPAFLSWLIAAARDANAVGLLIW